MQRSGQNSIDQLIKWQIHDYAGQTTVRSQNRSKFPEYAILRHGNGKIGATGGQN